MGNSYESSGLIVLISVGSILSVFATSIINVVSVLVFVLAFVGVTVMIRRLDRETPAPVARVPIVDTLDKAKARRELAQATRAAIDEFEREST